MKIVKFVFNVFAFIIVNIAFLTLIFFLIMGIFDFVVNYIPSFLVNIVEILSSDNFQTSLLIYFKIWEYILYFENHFLSSAIICIVYIFIHLIVWQIFMFIFEKIKQSYNFIYGVEEEQKEND